MAVTSIWRVNGWLGKVVVYVENPEKTSNPEFYENGDMTERECQGLDVRIIGSSKVDLKQMVQQGTFSEEFYYMLQGLTLKELVEKTEEITVYSAEMYYI